MVQSVCCSSTARACLGCRMWPARSWLPSAGFGGAEWTLLLSRGRSQQSKVHHSGLPITLCLGCSASLLALGEKLHGAESRGCAPLPLGPSAAGILPLPPTS